MSNSDHTANLGRTPNLERIKRVSRWVRALCTFGIVATPIVAAGVWATFGQWAASVPVVARFGPFPEPMPELPPILAFAATMVPGGISMLALARLRRLFGLYAEGLIFTAENARHLRGFAAWVMALAVARPLSSGLVSGALTSANPPVQRAIAIDLSSADLATLFVGLVFLVIAWVLDEGRALADDNAQIV